MVVLFDIIMSYIHYMLSVSTHFHHNLFHCSHYIFMCSSVLLCIFYLVLIFTIMSYRMHFLCRYWSCYSMLLFFLCIYPLICVFVFNITVSVVDVLCVWCIFWLVGHLQFWLWRMVIFRFLLWIGSLSICPYLSYSIFTHYLFCNNWVLFLSFSSSLLICDLFYGGFLNLVLFLVVVLLTILPWYMNIL